ncbi:hypothetical protein J437_LFUL017431 [Ladona fulva]|uniref:PiggyBac transposable element-derived protein domain-containing protein n=1 Tax=Ladona fulva TaxID=123851 RepID=A0A8K0KS85_LADFU|nr:hypothetical protein J437_LFUL017431 [Ladona fulva]
MEKVYYLDKRLSIDESMVLWRGRLFFKQYIKGKRHKYGVKLYMLTLPNGLVQSCTIYSGARDDKIGGVNHAEKVVKHLMGKKLNKGHSLFMDNFYNSISVAKFLLENKTYVTGTLRANRKGNPCEITSKTLKRVECVEMFTEDGISILKWKDRRDVLMISSEFDGEMTEVTDRRGNKASKPRAVLEYNKSMGGVDLFDQMMAYYPCERKTLRSRFHKWVPTTPNEIRVYLGLLMLMGIIQIIQKPSLRMYFSRKHILEAPFFPNVMSEERFALLNKFLHFVDNSDKEITKRDPKLYKILPIKYFELFFDDDLIKIIVTETNRDAEQFLAHEEKILTLKSSRFHKWVPTTPNEIRVLDYGRD